MFVDKGTALFSVTFQASLFIAFRLIHQARTRREPPHGSKGAMRIMAVRALDRAFVNAMLEGHRELRPHGGVTTVTQVRLPARQQKFRCLSFVNRMAIRANDVVHGMRGMANIRPRQRFAMTGEASVQNLPRFQLRERDDGRFAAVRLNVRSARPVTSFAPSFLRWFFPRNQAFEMWILVKPQPYVGMTALADRASYKSIVVRGFRGITKSGTQQRREKTGSHCPRIAGREREVVNEL